MVYALFSRWGDESPLEAVVPLVPRDKSHEGPNEAESDVEFEYLQVLVFDDWAH